MVVAKVRDMKADEGFNALTDEYENLVEAGVIDPTKVVRSALQNAASIASLLLTTEALVCEIPEEKGEKRPGGMPRRRRDVLTADRPLRLPTGEPQCAGGGATPGSRRSQAGGCSPNRTTLRRARCDRDRR